MIEKGLMDGLPSARRDEAHAPIRAIKSPKSGIAIAHKQVNKTKINLINIS